MYKFKSKAAGDLILLETAGDALLKIIGKEPAAKGIIETRSMPAAIEALERAVADDEAARSAVAADAAVDAPVAGESPREKVSLRQRAWPLIDMLRRSHAAEADIVWGV